MGVQDGINEVGECEACGSTGGQLHGFSQGEAAQAGDGVGLLARRRCRRTNDEHDVCFDIQE